jgi:hypothetical protein
MDAVLLDTCVLLKVGAKPDAVERRIEMMTMYFPDARVDGSRPPGRLRQHRRRHPRR